MPAELIVVLVRPEQQMRTAEARAVLPRELPRDVALHQAAQVGALVAALALGDYALLGPRDRRPDRRAGPRGTAARVRRGEGGGARGGRARQLDLGQRPDGVRARPAGRAAGERVAAAMVAAYAAAGMRSEARVAPVDRVGARLIEPTGGGA